MKQSIRYLFYCLVGTFSFVQWVNGQGGITNASIVGTVRDNQTQTPLQGAMMVLNVGVAQGTALDTTYTDASGNYQFTGINVGRNERVTVSAALNNYLSAFQQAVGLQSDETDTLDFTLVPSGGPIDTGSATGTFTGTVREDSSTGAPITSALVSLISGTGPIGTVLQTISTDAQGNYTLSNVPATGNRAIYSISVSAPNFEPVLQTPFNLDSGQTDTVDFFLISMDPAASWTVSGTVTADSTGGQFISGAQVQISSLRGGENIYLGTTDANGNYTILIPNLPDQYTISASSSGYYPTLATQMISGDSTTVDIVMATDTTQSGLSHAVDRWIPFQVIQTRRGVYRLNVTSAENYHAMVFGLNGEKLLETSGRAAGPWITVYLPGWTGITYWKLEVGGENYGVVIQ